MLKRIGIFPSLKKAEAIEFSLSLFEFLKNRGLEPLFREELQGSLPQGAKTFPPGEPDFVLSLGGDGTLLQCVHRVWDHCPILGVNLGNLGFLTASDRNRLYEDLERVLEGEYLVQERDLIQVEFKGKELLGLNECSIAQVNVGKIFTLLLKINGVDMGELRGDGVLVSTATGSTAYALACNGPLISPFLHVLLLCVISPHSLSTRPLVLLPEDEVQIFLPEGELGYLVIDGQDRLPLSAGDEVKVTLSSRKAKLVFFEEDFFLRVIPKKLLWGHP
ncbi:MAG: NAD(+)/NADH kinase [Caldiserica bacterium]|jgi:NAD+ kinase|nr:NAD(+)/NADH kinase [Caldisericota bacterium]MDH7562932.1 NAD(+)/NADH kinase [Caldisericota bacterium]